MKILFINANGAGFADFVEVPEGTTVAQFIGKQLSTSAPSDLLIRVNRLPVSADQVLQEGDRCSATPVKIEGA